METENFKKKVDQFFKDGANKAREMADSFPKEEVERKIRSGAENIRGKAAEIRKLPSFKKVVYGCGALLAIIIAIFYLSKDPNSDIKGMWYCDFTEDSRGDLFGGYINLDTDANMIYMGFYREGKLRDPVMESEFTLVQRKKSEKNEKIVIEFPNENQIKFILQDGKLFTPGIFNVSECLRQIPEKKKRDR